MADLLFAASAAEDDVAAHVLAAARRFEGAVEEAMEFETVDDMEVAASAAAAAQWPVETPLPQLPLHAARDLAQEAMECETESENEDGSSVSSDPAPLKEAEIGPVAVTLVLEPWGDQDGFDPDEMQTSDVRVRLELQTAARHVEIQRPVEADAMEVDTCTDAEREIPRTVEVPEAALCEGEGLQIVGSVQSRVEEQLVVQAQTLVRPLDAGSVLFTLDGDVVGTVVDIFGSVEAPLYLVNARSNDAPLLGTKVYSTERLSIYLDFLTQEPHVTSESASESDDAQPSAPPRNRRAANRRRRRDPRTRPYVASMPQPVYDPQWAPPFAGPHSFHPQAPYPVPFGYPVYPPVAFQGFHPYTAFSPPTSNLPPHSQTSHHPN